MKNYIIYEYDNEIKRQVVNLHDIYPLSVALDNLPENHNLIAKIITSKITNGMQCFKGGLNTSWYKHAWITDYPDYESWQIAQKEFKNKYLPLLTSKEQNMLKGL